MNIQGWKLGAAMAAIAALVLTAACGDDDDGGGAGAAGASAGAAGSGAGVTQAQCVSRCSTKATTCGATSDQLGQICNAYCPGPISEAQAECYENEDCATLGAGTSTCASTSGPGGASGASGAAGSTAGSNGSSFTYCNNGVGYACPDSDTFDACTGSGNCGACVSDPAACD